MHLMGEKIRSGRLALRRTPAPPLKRDPSASASPEPQVRAESGPRTSKGLQEGPGRGRQAGRKRLADEMAAGSSTGGAAQPAGHGTLGKQAPANTASRHAAGGPAPSLAGGAGSQAADEAATASGLAERVVDVDTVMADTWQGAEKGDAALREAVLGRNDIEDIVADEDEQFCTRRFRSDLWDFIATEVRAGAAMRAALVQWLEAALCCIQGIRPQVWNFVAPAVHAGEAADACKGGV